MEPFFFLWNVPAFSFFVKCSFCYCTVYLPSWSAVLHRYFDLHSRSLWLKVSECSPSLEYCLLQTWEWSPLSLSTGLICHKFATMYIHCFPNWSSSWWLDAQIQFLCASSDASCFLDFFFSVLIFFKKITINVGSEFKIHKPQYNRSNLKYNFICS